jgi:hypothetical protein
MRTVLKRKTIATIQRIDEVLRNYFDTFGQQRLWQCQQ